MMTDHSNGLADSETGVLKINDYARHRVTGGITLSLSKPLLLIFVSTLRSISIRSPGSQRVGA